MRAYEPASVREGRDRKLAGDRLPEYQREPRPYFCRGCGEREVGLLVPRGWYALTRATGSLEMRPPRLGLYCNLRCLGAQLERLVGIEDKLGGAFDRRPPDFRQEPTP